jgi:hypothetical protein
MIALSRFDLRSLDQRGFTLKGVVGEGVGEKAFVSLCSV